MYLLFCTVLFVIAGIQVMDESVPAAVVLFGMAVLSVIVAIYDTVDAFK